MFHFFSKKVVLSTWIALGNFLCLYAQTNPTQGTYNFGIITRNNATFRNGDTHSPVFVGGNLIIENVFDFSNNHSGTLTFPGDARPTHLIVRGQLNLQGSGSKGNINSSGYIKVGNANGYYQDNSQGNTRVVGSNGVFLQVNGTQPLGSVFVGTNVIDQYFNVENLFKTYIDFSNQLRIQEPNFTFNLVNSNNYQFYLKNNQTNIINLTGSQISNLAEFRFEQRGPSTTSPLVINIDMQGQDVNLSGPMYISGNGISLGNINDLGKYVLYHFYNGNGKTVNITNGTPRGTIYAPQNKVVKKLSSGDIEGQVIANEYVHEGGEVHYQIFGIPLTLPTVKVFDLALRKSVKSGTKNPVLYPGDQITYTISILNQNNVDAQNVQITDYIPSGLTLNDPNWTLFSNGKAKLNQKISTINEGGTVSRDITFIINSNALGEIVNSAEISEVSNALNLTDIDSSPDENPSNDLIVKDDIITENGKSGGDEDDHDVESIIVINKPFTDTEIRFCKGAYPLLGYGSCPTGYELKWYANSGATNAVISSTVSPTQNTRYYGRCEKESNFSPLLSVLLIPEEKPNIRVNSSEINLCSNSSIILQAECSSAANVVWYSDALGTQVLSSTTVQPVVSTTYYAKCNNTYCESEIVSVLVNPRPSIPTTLNVALCAGDTITIPAFCSGNLVPKFFLDSSLSKSISSTILMPAIDTKYYVYCQDENGCKSEALEMELWAVLPDTISVDSKQICKGDSAQLEVLGCSGSVVWNTGQTTSTITVNPLETTTYIVTCTSDQGCTSEAMAEVVVNEMINPQITATTITCTDDALVSIQTNDVVNVSWIVPNGVINPGNVKSFETSIPGIYTAVVTNNVQCRVGLTVTVIEDKKVLPVLYNSQILDCKLDSIRISVEHLNADIISWQVPNGVENPGTVKTLFTSTPGTYIAQNLSSNGCIQMFSFEVHPPVQPEAPSQISYLVCEGETIVLNNVCTSGEIRWFTDSTLTTELLSNIIMPTTSTTYNAVCVENQCMSEKAFATINVVTGLSVPKLDSMKTEIKRGEEVQLHATCEVGNVVWATDSLFSEIITQLWVQPDSTTIYYVSCNELFCSNKTNVIVNVREPIFDLALKKILTPGQESIFKIGSEVSFDIIIYNQGEVLATEIEIVDYIPLGLTLNDNRWTLVGNKAYLNIPINSLEPGKDSTITIKFLINELATNSSIKGYAEIHAAKGGIDIDSLLDDQYGNDGISKDDEIHEDGVEDRDKDNIDYAEVKICNTQTCIKSTAKRIK